MNTNDITPEIAESDGYDQALSGKGQIEPVYLRLNPELKVYWDNGYSLGESHKEAVHCFQCHGSEALTW